MSINGTTPDYSPYPPQPPSHWYDGSEESPPTKPNNSQMPVSERPRGDSLEIDRRPPVKPPSFESNCIDTRDIDLKIYHTRVVSKDEILDQELRNLAGDKLRELEEQRKQLIAEAYEKQKAAQN